MRSRTCVIVNPHAGAGRTGRDWPRLARRLGQGIGDFTTVFTDRPRAATNLAARAARAGYTRIIAVGGDGTLSEVVDGLFADHRSIAPELEIGHLCRGTGGDFRRNFAVDTDHALAALASGRTRSIDVGYLTYLDHDGHPARRTFVNVASAGLGGWVDRRVNRAGTSKRLGRFAFYLHALAALASYRGAAVDLAVDGQTVHQGPLTIACVCNGAYAGGGMKFAPAAVVDDGWLDVVVISTGAQALADSRDRWHQLVAAAQLGLGLPALYRGHHLGRDGVIAVRGRRITASPIEETPVLLDVDGEAPGRLPATFELLPGALRWLG